MISAVDDKGFEVSAGHAVKGGKYFCPVCGSRVTYKSGNIKVPHFSHFKIMDCLRYFYKSESLEHLKIKNDIYLMLSPEVRVSMEYYLSDIEQIPDLLVENRTALEIQLSSISPELIAERTRGYHSVNLNVVWILNDENIRREGGHCLPTHFQLSTMQYGVLTTYEMTQKKFYQYILLHHIGSGRWIYKRTEVSVFDCLKLRPFQDKGRYTLKRSDIKIFLKKERQKKTVLNPVLSFMYHLGLTEDTLPDYLCVITPAERWIMNHPVEWKLYLKFHLERKSFHMEAFNHFIKLRTTIDTPEKNKVIQQLLNHYIMLYNSQ